MTKLAAIGGSEFVVGFQLAGIRKTIEIDEDIMSQINDLKEDKDIGIVVIDQNTLEKLDLIERDEIEESINPVFIPISTEVSQDSLKKLIKKSIGVDLWK